MALAAGPRFDQVAALIGIQPIANDPGQPARLALNKEEAVREAAAELVAQPVPAQEPAQSVTVELRPSRPRPSR
jgi:hypothetical protein